MEEKRPRSSREKYMPRLRRYWSPNCWHTCPTVGVEVLADGGLVVVALRADVVHHPRRLVARAHDGCTGVCRLAPKDRHPRFYPNPKQGTPGSQASCAAAGAGRAGAAGRARCSPCPCPCSRAGRAGCLRRPASS
eukprot:scaffold107255_cov54-Phaeocystis_antarctica.AAC.3